MRDRLSRAKSPFFAIFLFRFAVGRRKTNAAPQRTPTPRLMSSRSLELCGAPPIVAGANDGNIPNLPHLEQVVVDADQ